MEVYDSLQRQANNCQIIVKKETSQKKIFK